MSKRTTRTTPRDYHVTLTDGSERNVRADELLVLDGALQFTRTDGEVKVAYAAGAWKSVELETQDDRG